MENKQKVIIVWKDGTYKLVNKKESLEYENDENWLTTIKSNGLILINNPELVLEQQINGMDNPNIVEPLKDRFNQKGYKAGYCDGWRELIHFMQNR